MRVHSLHACATAGAAATKQQCQKQRITGAAIIVTAGPPPPTSKEHAGAASAPHRATNARACRRRIAEGRPHIPAAARHVAHARPHLAARSPKSLAPPPLNPKIYVSIRFRTRVLCVDGPLGAANPGCVLGCGPPSGAKKPLPTPLPPCNSNQVTNQANGLERPARLQCCNPRPATAKNCKLHNNRSSS